MPKGLSDGEEQDRSPKLDARKLLSVRHTTRSCIHRRASRKAAFKASFLLLLFYLATKHCYTDGNKRIAWACTTFVLLSFGLTVEATEDEVSNSAWLSPVGKLTVALRLRHGYVRACVQFCSPFERVVRHGHRPLPQEESLWGACETG